MFAINEINCEPKATTMRGLQCDPKATGFATLIDLDDAVDLANEEKAAQEANCTFRIKQTVE